MEFLEWLRRRALERHSVRPRKATGGECKPAPLFDAPLRFPLRFQCETAIEAPRDTSRRSRPPTSAGWLFESAIAARWCREWFPKQVLGCGRRRLFAPTLLEGYVCKPIEPCERHRCRTPSPPAGSACRASYAHAIPRQSKQANGRRTAAQRL